MTLHVDGVERTGRHVLKAGELVTLVRSQQAQPIASRGPRASAGVAAVDGPTAGSAREAAHPTKRARMVLSAAEAEPPAALSADPTPASSAAPVATATFLRYYEAQRVAPPPAWAQALRLLREPMPLCVRANTSAAPRAEALAQLRSLLGHRCACDKTTESGPLHDMVIPNIVRCIAYEREFGENIVHYAIGVH